MLEIKKEILLKLIKTLVLFFIVISGNYNNIYAQSVGISDAIITPDPSSLLEIRSSEKGFLMPRMTETERDNIVDPATGLIIYNSTTNYFNFYNGITWIEMNTPENIVSSVTGTMNFIDIAGTAINPIINISSAYPGQTSINTLGTISSGTWNGSIISPAYGGTGTSTTFTAGSVLFAGTGGIYNQNNSNFYWDNTNSRLGIGKSSPGSTLDVKGALRLSGSTSGYVGLTPAAAAGSTTYTLPSADGSSNYVLSTNGSGILSWASIAANAWGLTGNSGTNPSTNFIGTTDNQDLVFKTNNIERARIISSSGDIKIGDATSGTIKATKELVMRQDGDTYGPSILRLRNRTGENGAIFETTDPSITLVDFIFKTSANQRNIRYEARSGSAKAGSPSFHIGGASPDNPTLAVGDSYAAFNTNLKVGNYTTPTEALDVTGNIKFSGALMPNDDAGSSGNALLSNGSSTPPTWGKIGLTTHVSGVLPIANGGTNSSTTLNNNRIMISNAGAIKESSALTNGQVLIGSTNAAPVAANLTEGNGIKITNSAGNITIANEPQIQQATATSSITTNNTSDISMSTPLKVTTTVAGDYMIFFTGIVSNSSSGRGVIVSLYINGNKITVAETESTAAGNDRNTATITYYAQSVGAGQEIEMRWRVESGTGTMTKRILIAQRVK